MHLDVDDLSSRRKTNSPYEISSIIFELYSKMSKFFLEKNSLTFFMGGDNFMVVSNDDAKNSVQTFINMIKNLSNYFQTFFSDFRIYKPFIEQFKWI